MEKGRGDKGEEEGRGKVVRGERGGECMFTVLSQCLSVFAMM